MTAKATKTAKAIVADLPDVLMSEDDGVRHLHLDSPWIQGSMRIAKPWDIELEYVQRMMAWLLFVEPACVPGLRVLQLGLGAGALTKFCHKRLGTDTTVVELNPQVIGACRRWFRLPQDNARLHVVQADAQDFICQPQWQGEADILQVDLYDHEAAGPVLDSAEFYQQCNQVLAAQGCMSVNLFGRRASFDRSVQRLAQAFGEDALWRFKPTREGNTIVLACKSTERPSSTQMQARANWVEQHWKLPARLWLRAMQPVVPRKG